MNAINDTIEFLAMDPSDEAWQAHWTHGYYPEICACPFCDPSTDVGGYIDLSPWQGWAN